MNRFEGKSVLLTGAASGMGRATAVRLAAEGASVFGVDRNEAGAKATAEAIGGKAYTVDVSNPDQVAAMVAAVEAEQGRIDLFCSNAGIGDGDPDRSNAASSPDAVWMRAWGVNVMAHVYAARAALPGMIKRGEGYFLNTVSAAGLLSQIGSATYGSTKHAALAFLEHIAIAHAEDGIRVAALCPQGVDTAMLGEASAASRDGVLTPEVVAEAALDGLASGHFLILPHPQVAEYARRRAEDPERWLAGMARLRRSMRAGA